MLETHRLYKILAMAIIAKVNAYRHKKGTFRHQKMMKKWRDGESEKTERKCTEQRREGERKEVENFSP